MSKNRYINTHFWDDTFIVNLDPIEKLVFIYCLTNPLTNIAGAYEISLRRIAFDTGIDQEMIQKILDRFRKADKMIYHDGWVLILNFIKNQATNPKVQIGIEEAVKLSPIWIRNRLGIAYQSLSHLIESNVIELESNVIELEPNETEPEKPKPPAPSAPKPKPDQFPIPRPDVDPALWAEWLAMRVKLKKPFTSHGYNRLIVDLGKLVAFDLNERLELAIDRKWLGLIFVEDKNGRSEKNGRTNNGNDRATGSGGKTEAEYEAMVEGFRNS